MQDSASGNEKETLEWVATVMHGRETHTMLKKKLQLVESWVIVCFVFIHTDQKVPVAHIAHHLDARRKNRTLKGGELPKLQRVWGVLTFVWKSCHCKEANAKDGQWSQSVVIAYSHLQTPTFFLIVNRIERSYTSHSDSTTMQSHVDFCFL